MAKRSPEVEQTPVNTQGSPGGLEAWEAWEACLRSLLDTSETPLGHFWDTSESLRDTSETPLRASGRPAGSPEEEVPSSGDARSTTPRLVRRLRLIACQICLLLWASRARLLVFPDHETVPDHGHLGHRLAATMPVSLAVPGYSLCHNEASPHDGAHTPLRHRLRLPCLTA